MSEYIGCRDCDCRSCSGCNLYTLELMLNTGKLDGLMDEHHSINYSADVAAVKHGEWIKHDCLTTDGAGNYTVKVGEVWVCSICGQDEKYREPYCHCGAKMDGGADK